MTRKLCLDFDGVLHSGECVHVDIIDGPPVEGALEFLREACRHFDVSIFSGRSREPAGRAAMQEWIENLAQDGTCRDIEYPSVKPMTHVMLDDRCLLFEGVYPSIDDLYAFEPWHKQEVR